MAHCSGGHSDIRGSTSYHSETCGMPNQRRTNELINSYRGLVTSSSQNNGSRSLCGPVDPYICAAGCMRQPLGSHTTPLSRFRSVGYNRCRLDADIGISGTHTAFSVDKGCQAPGPLMVTSYWRNVQEDQLKVHIQGKSRF